ncbi:helix-turn-helix domain-containing protein [Streptomyces sp. NPDC048297]|uniref:helix-turn-helix domain-containing protein n=1 Tax=Streptomyces sp. NPDC048297 TaxID=3365531 RepID=UPI0037140AB1
MTSKQRNASPHPKTRPSSGVTHVNEPHHDNFTVVGNHLAQHAELSLVAIGLALHVQSLPEGAPIGIKALAARFPEGEIRIAAALRELEEHGYLSRTKERLQSGRVTTRTTSYNRPRGAVVEAAAPVPPEAERPQCRTKAADLLAGLRAHDSRLLLTERDVHRLAPAVTEWLDRGVPPTAVVRTLTTGLPQDPIKHPAALLSHRLTAQLPPHLPPPPPSAPSLHPAPLQNCEGCDRAFRSPHPGRCRECSASSVAVA